MVISRKVLKILTFSIWSFIIAASVCAAPPDNEKAFALIRQGQEFFKSCRYEDAQNVYDIVATIFREINDISGQGNVFRYRGDIFSRTGDNANALSTYAMALSIYLKANDTMGQSSVFIGMGQVYMRTGENKKALELYEKSLSISKERNDATGQGNAYRSIGDLYLRKRDFSKATEMYNRALLIYQGSNDRAGLGSVYRGMGEIHMRMGDNVKARTFQDNAMTFYRQANDCHGEGDVYWSIGDIHYFTTDNAAAMEMYNLALPFFLKAKEPAGQGYIYLRMGEIYLRTGNNERALEMFSQALPLYQQVNDPIGLGDVHFDTARFNYYKRDYQRALEMYEKALPYYSKAEDPRGMGNVYRGMGNVYLRVGDYQRTLAYCAKAFTHYVQANSPLGQANVYWNMGEAHFYLGDYPKALETYRKALSLYQKVGEPIGQGVLYQDMGEIYFKSGDYQKALDMNEKALAFCLQAGSLIDQVRVYRSLGDIYAKTGKDEQSLRMYEVALDISRKIADIDAEAYILVNKAAVLGHTGKISAAAELYEEGMVRFERVRRQSGFSEMKKNYMEKVYDHYENATMFMIANLYVDKAFKYAEAMKARVFMDQLAEGLINLDKGINPELKMRRDEIENQLLLIQKQIADESQRKQADEAKITTLKSGYARTEEELEAVKRDIHYKNPLYAAVQYPEPVLLADLQNKILKQDEVILEYFMSRDSIYCFVVSRHEYRIIKLGLWPGSAEALPVIGDQTSTDSARVKAGGIEKPSGKKSQIEALENAVNELLESLRVETTEEGWKRTAAVRLYEVLIKPVEAHIKDKTVIIIPDGILTRLPFEVLIAKDEEGSRYLVQKYRIKYVQSASVLGILRTQYKKDGLNNKFIGFGDPVYDYENFKAGKPEDGSDVKGQKSEAVPVEITRSSYLRAGGKLDRLAGSGEEIKAISRIFSEQKIESNSLLRLDARENYAEAKEMDGYGYIHFSTHGILNDKFQAIVLSQIPEDHEDGYLTLGKIMNSRYNAHLVVLSACDTGLGRIERGEGVTGLTRAVMYAGTPAAIVSLWSVSDEGTKELMTSFYKNLIKKRMSKDEALRQAKIEMIGRKNNDSKMEKASDETLRSVKITGRSRSLTYSHPFFWSAFVMYGE